MCILWWIKAKKKSIRSANTFWLDFEQSTFQIGASRLKSVKVWWENSINKSKNNTKNNKLNEPHKFVLNLPQRSDVKSSNKHVTYQNLTIYCMWKNLKKELKNKKPKIIALTWNDEF